MRLVLFRFISMIKSLRLRDFRRVLEARGMGRIDLLKTFFFTAACVS